MTANLYRVFFGGDENLPQLVEQLCEYIKVTKLCTLNGWIWGYMSYISKKLLC